MKLYRMWGSRGLAAAALLPLLAGAVEAANITNLKIVEASGKRQLVIELNGSGPRAQLATAQRDQAWVVEMKDTQLKTGTNSSGNFRVDRPGPGFDLLEATQVEPNTVRVRLVGVEQPPAVTLGENSTSRIVFDLGPAAGPTALQAAASSVTGTQPDSGANGSAPVRFSARAVAPPTGDIAIGEITVGKPVELETNDRITLVLKDAPVREVLQILARRAGHNILFSNDVGNQRVSMDIQNEALEDTFNFVLRLNNLKGRRVGKTILVGTEIAQDLLQTQVRTFRLNQADVTRVAGVLRGLGAQVTGASLVGAGAAGAGGGAGAAGGLGGAAGGLGAAPGGANAQIGNGPLKGELFVTLDQRTNSLTAIGTPRALQIAQAQVAQLDVRQRQVMIDVKLVDVNLNNITDFGFRTGGSAGNFSLGSLGNQAFAGQDYVYELPDATTGLSKQVPSALSPQIGPAALGTITGTNGVPGGTFIFNTLSALTNAIALRLDTAIQNGSAKVLAAPKIVLEAGESFTKPTKAVVDITDDVIVGTTISVDPATGLTTTTVKIDKVGVVMDVNLFQVDDNGFVSVALKPQISSISSIQRDVQGNLVTLLTRRNLDVQKVRLRDGQTFVIGGIIRESDRSILQKIPILGDLPILGALFRFQSNQVDRREVALMVTPHILRDPSVEPPPVAAVPVASQPTQLGSLPAK